MSQLNLFQKRAEKIEQKIPVDVREKAIALMAKMIIAIQVKDKGALRDKKPKNNQ